MNPARSCLFCLLMSLVVPLWAGGGKTLPGMLGKSLTPQEKRLQTVISSHMDRAVLRASQTARLAHFNREAYFKSAKTIPFRSMATLSAPKVYLPKETTDPLFVLRNDKMALPWFETIEKDLVFLRGQKAAIRQNLSVQQLPPEQIYYPDIIPASVTKIYVGEEHEQPAIYQAFEQMVLQYRQAYPQRKVIVLTEFVSDRLLPWQLPGKPVGMISLYLRWHDKNFAFFTKLKKAGVEIVGLENIAYLKEHEALITPSESEAQSVYGMQERNAHWRRIISYVADQNPRATLFIYAGSMHTHYRAPFSLATPSPQNFVLQLESQTLGADMPFGFVMRREKFTQVSDSKATVLRWKEDLVLRTRSGFDACIIFP